MNRATRQKLLALRSLADHPNTPEQERENAQARIVEIEQKVQRQRAGRYRSSKESNPRARSMEARVTRRGLANLKRAVRAKSVVQEDILQDRWPFGWTGPRDEIVEYEKGYSPDGSYALGWKCPDCGSHVSRVIAENVVRQFELRPKDFREYIDRILGGNTNHLCVDCWQKWEIR